MMLPTSRCGLRQNNALGLGQIICLEVLPLVRISCMRCKRKLTAITIIERRMQDTLAEPYVATAP